MTEVHWEGALRMTLPSSLQKEGESSKEKPRTGPWVYIFTDQFFSFKKQMAHCFTFPGLKVKDLF